MSCQQTFFLLSPVAPIKALCSQCYESWSRKFGPLGLTCKELTGDTEIDDLFEIHDSHIILTTPVCYLTLHLNQTRKPFVCNTIVSIQFYIYSHLDFCVYLLGKVGQHDKEMEG